MMRSERSFGLLFGLIVIAFAGLVALGVWQVHRLAWKEALIARVDARVAAPVRPAPGPSQWHSISAKNSEYLHVLLNGHYRLDRSVLTKAVTDLGSGYWVLSPFETQRGFTVLVNRGFIPDSAGKNASMAPAGPMIITGLLRMSEPGGGFLRYNDPAANRWYSRDVTAIANALHLGPVAPYFVDAAATKPPVGYSSGEPVAGLTRISFPNNHLVYAITWFVLAAMAAFAACRLILERIRPQRG